MAGYEGAQQACGAALGVGNDSRFLIEAAKLALKEKDASRALKLLDHALGIEPQNRDALLQRYFARISLGDLLGAGADLLLGRELDPADRDITEQANWMISKLRYEGAMAAKAGRYADAVHVFSLGLRFAPADQDLKKWMEYSEAGLKRRSRP